MALGRVHRLGEADVGADGGAEEVEEPEGGDDASVDLPDVEERKMCFARRLGDWGLHCWINGYGCKMGGGNVV